MDTVDWRAQLPPGSRQVQVNEIISKLSFYSPTVDEDMSVEVRKIAQSLEHKIYADAASEVDYMHKISMKIQLILGYSWRAQLTLDSRQRIANKILETLRRCLPVSGPEGLYQLRIIAERFEEKIYTTATSQSDYLRKISLKMLTMENQRPNPVNNSVTLNPSGDVSSYWRAQLSLYSRQRIVNKILDTLRRHLPVTGPEGLVELRKIAERFEEKIYTAATSQSDYLRKISLKMLTIEDRQGFI